GERLRYTDRFDDPNLPGEIQVTITLKKVSVGTEIHIAQDGVPDAIPAEACYLVWQESLAQLANLVEPNIPYWRWPATGYTVRYLVSSGPLSVPTRRFALGRRWSVHARSRAGGDVPYGRSGG